MFISGNMRKEKQKTHNRKWHSKTMQTRHTDWKGKAKVTACCCHFYSAQPVLRQKVVYINRRTRTYRVTRWSKRGDCTILLQISAFSQSAWSNNRWLLDDYSIHMSALNFLFTAIYSVCCIYVTTASTAFNKWVYFSNLQTACPVFVLLYFRKPFVTTWSETTDRKYNENRMKTFLPCVVINLYRPFSNKLNKTAWWVISHHGGRGSWEKNEQI